MSSHTDIQGKQQDEERVNVRVEKPMEMYVVQDRYLHKNEEHKTNNVGCDLIEHFPFY
jgi:hypothetical protein